MLMLNVPATVGLIVLAQPIVSLLLERGRFTADDTAATAAALMFYAPGLARLLRREDRVAELLFAPRQPHAGDRQRVVGARQSRRSTSRSSM